MNTLLQRLYPWYHLWVEGWRDALRALPRRRRRGLPGVCLPAQQVLLRRLVLPALPVQQRLTAVDGEVAIASPFPADQTVSGHRVTTLPDGRMQIDIAIVRADQLPPSGPVYVQGPHGPIALRQSPPNRWSRWLTGVLLFLLALVLLAYAAAPLAYQRVKSLAHIRAHDELAQRTGPLQYEREQLQRQVDQYQQLLADAATHVDLLSALDRLSAALPDDAYLNVLRLQDQQIVIEGQAANALALVGHLQSQPGFAAVQLVGAVQRDPQSGKDRFQIQYRPQP